MASSSFDHPDAAALAPSWTARPAHEYGESERARSAADAYELTARRRAARTVAGQARDLADCRVLLSVLGLDANDVRND